MFVAYCLSAGNRFVFNVVARYKPKLHLSIFVNKQSLVLATLFYNLFVDIKWSNDWTSIISQSIPTSNNSFAACSTSRNMGHYPNAMSLPVFIVSITPIGVWIHHGFNGIFSFNRYPFNIRLLKLVHHTLINCKTGCNRVFLGTKTWIPLTAFMIIPIGDLNQIPSNLWPLVLIIGGLLLTYRSILWVAKSSLMMIWTAYEWNNPRVLGSNGAKTS
jgi:hypothetical protein